MTPPSGEFEELIDLRDHPLQRDHWWGTPEFSAAFGPLSINEIIARIGADLGVVGDFSAPVPLGFRDRPDAEGLVLLVADADGTAKRWASERWVELAAALGRRGLDVAVVTRGDRQHPPLGGSIGLAEHRGAAKPRWKAVDVLERVSTPSSGWIPV